MWSPVRLSLNDARAASAVNDDVFHNAFSRSKAAPFDLGVYGNGTTKYRTFPDPGLVNVYCNIHPDMACTILVLDNAHFAKSDSDGYWVMTGIPDGTFLLRTWHRHGGGTEQSVELEGGAIVRIDETVEEDRRTVPHRNKFGRPYRSKY